MITTPMRRRECLLVLLSTKATVSPADTAAAEARLLQSWHRLHTQLAPLWR